MSRRWIVLAGVLAAALTGCGGPDTAEVLDRALVACKAKVPAEFKHPDKVRFHPDSAALPPTRRASEDGWTLSGGVDAPTDVGVMQTYAWGCTVDGDGKVLAHTVTKVD